MNNCGASGWNQLSIVLAALIDFFEGERRFVVITTETDESVRKIHGCMLLIIVEISLETG
ncbi:MAG: hypothetical protein ACOYJI_07575 [Anaerovoracaceae bacterium]|jgi:hypothetical protein